MHTFPTILNPSLRCPIYRRYIFAYVSYCIKHAFFVRYVGNIFTLKTSSIFRQFIGNIFSHPFPTVLNTPLFSPISRKYIFTFVSSYIKPATLSSNILEIYFCFITYKIIPRFSNPEMRYENNTFFNSEIHFVQYIGNIFTLSNILDIIYV